jgi:Domain of unknown function (DUF4920)
MRKQLLSAALAAAMWMPAAVLPAAETEVYGAGVDVEEATPILDIVADPDAFIGKTVRIEGTVLDVCPKKGCWIEVGAGGGTIQVKVDDDVIVFPASTKGRIANAQGKVEAIEMSRERYVAWLGHVAEEKGETFDAAKADLGEGPYRIIRIRGTGARIE